MDVIPTIINELIGPFFTFLKKKNKKINEKSGFSFQSGPNLMSFTFKRGVGVKIFGKVPGRKCSPKF